MQHQALLLRIPARGTSGVTQEIVERETAVVERELFGHSRTERAPTLGGREHMFGEGAIHGPLEDMLRPILRGTLAYIGLDVLPPFVAYHVPYLPQPEREAIMQAYQAHLNQLDQLEPLVMPSLNDYDATMHPLVKPD